MCMVCDKKWEYTLVLENEQVCCCEAEDRSGIAPRQLWDVIQGCASQLTSRLTATQKDDRGDAFSRGIEV